VSKAICRTPSATTASVRHLDPSRSGAGLAPSLLLLLALLVGFCLPPEANLLSAQLVALPFCLFASPSLLGHPLVHRGLRHLAAGTCGVELLLNLSL
jgi:hypothetical protein